MYVCSHTTGYYPRPLLNQCRLHKSKKHPPGTRQMCGSQKEVLGEVIQEEAAEAAAEAAAAAAAAAAGEEEARSITAGDKLEPSL